MTLPVTRWAPLVVAGGQSGRPRQVRRCWFRLGQSCPLRDCAGDDSNGASDWWIASTSPSLPTTTSVHLRQVVGGSHAVVMDQKGIRSLGTHSIYFFISSDENDIRWGRVRFRLSERRVAVRANELAETTLSQTALASETSGTIHTVFK